MPDVPIHLDVRGSAVHVLLDRPERANAISAPMWRALPELVAHASRLPGVRCLVLASTSDAVFSAGVDVAQFGRHEADWAQNSQRLVSAASAAIADCEIPTVARVAGPCAGGAIALVAACDLRFAARNAVFSVPAARLGLAHPPSDTARLVRLIGGSSTKRLLLTGAHLDASWALRVGLIDEMVSDDDLDAAIDQLVNQVAGGSAVAIRAMRATVESVASDRGGGDEAADLVSQLWLHADHREGTRAVMEGRPPRFAGP